MITISNSEFCAVGSSNKDTVFGITLGGNKDIVLKNCNFKSTGYSAILNNCAGNVSIEDCIFDCENNYNPIEGSQSIENKNLSVKNCEFKSAPGNNFINIYNLKENAEVSISNCKFNEATVNNNIIRISNKKNSTINCKIKDCEYNFDGEPNDYTALVLCQDYTNKSGLKQDFSKVNISIDNVKCNSVAINSDGAPIGNIYYVYEDGVGVITGQNDPIITVK